MLSMPEANLWGEASRINEDRYWLLSPKSYVEGNGDEFFVNADGTISSEIVSLKNFFTAYHQTARPVISLKPSTKYTSGDGTVKSPFIIPTE